LSSSQAIEHKGFIERINGNSIYVKILSQPACDVCNARGACSVSEIQHKEVEVMDISGKYKKGEVVDVVMSQVQGYKALLIAYVYPFILVFLTLLVTTLLGLNELNAGLFSLAILPPYYLIIFILRNKIKRIFVFSIRKSD
jgi:positive regulator of sigma E activity